MSTMDELLDRIGNSVTEELVPKLMSELADDERARIREAVVERAILAIKEGKNSNHRHLVERAEGEVWDMLRKHPQVVAAIKEVADGMAALTVETIRKAAPRLQETLVNRFNEVMQRRF